MSFTGFRRIGYSWLGERKKAFPAGEFSGPVNVCQQSQKVERVCKMKKNEFVYGVMMYKQEKLAEPE